jgi:hypothetical protein
LPEFDKKFLVNNITHSLCLHRPRKRDTRPRFHDSRTKSTPRFRDSLQTKAFYKIPNRNART